MSHLRSKRNSIPFIDYQKCLAKTSEKGQPGMTVLEHCRIAGAVALDEIGLVAAAELLC